MIPGGLSAFYLRQAIASDSVSILSKSVMDSCCVWLLPPFSARLQDFLGYDANTFNVVLVFTPHIVAVTFEPMPSRLASIAMGTGDVDCTYHGALYELMEAVQEIGNEDQADILNTLVGGHRLRDISDLPFDLAI